MKPRVRIEPEALEELRAARDWYNERRDGLGRQFVEAASEAVSRIRSMPNSGTPVPGVPLDLEVRRVFVQRFPYSAVFIELEDSISVVAFAHMKRRPGYWLRRMKP